MPREVCSMTQIFREIDQGERVRAVHCSRSARRDAPRNRGIVQADRGGQSEAAGRQIIPARAGRRSAQVHGIAAIDGQAGADPLDSSASAFSGNLQLRGNLQLTFNLYLRAQPIIQFDQQFVD